MPKNNEIQMLPPVKVSKMFTDIIEMTECEIKESFGIDARLMGNEKGKDVKTKPIVEWG